MNCFKSHPTHNHGLSASTLKLLAALFMLVDHVGLIFFPTLPLFRIIGRLAFPLFAYFIAEGCRYTRNKLKRFLLVFLLGVLCESAYFFYTHEIEGNVLLTFSLSILLIYLLQCLKRSIARKKPRQIALSALLFSLSVAAAYPISVFLDLDYGFMGVLLPLFVTVLDYRESEAPAFLKHCDLPHYKLCSFFFGLLLLVYTKGFSSLQVWCLPSILLLALYNGREGTKRMKYWFYVFYPLHLLLLELIAFLVLHP